MSGAFVCGSGGGLAGGPHVFDLHGPDEARHPEAQEREGCGFAYLLGIVSEADDGPEVPVHEVCTGAEVGLLHSHYCHQTPLSHTRFRAPEIVRAFDPREAAITV